MAGVAQMVSCGTLSSPKLDTRSCPEHNLDLKDVENAAAISGGASGTLAFCNLPLLEFGRSLRGACSVRTITARRILDLYFATPPRPAQSHSDASPEWFGACGRWWRLSLQQRVSATRRAYFRSLLLCVCEQHLRIV